MTNIIFKTFYYILSKWPIPGTSSSRQQKKSTAFIESSSDETLDEGKSWDHRKERGAGKCPKDALCKKYF